MCLLLFSNFALNDVIAAIVRCRRSALWFRLRLSLGIELLAQRMERLLDTFTRLLDAADIVALCSGFQIVDLAFDRAAFGCRNFIA